MFTATSDVLLPTTVVGSWPRPAWFTSNLNGRPFSTGLTDLAYREQFLDATSALISDQEYAGLDILVNGDYHMDGDFAGGSWHGYVLERLAGMTDYRSDATDPRYDGPAGSLTHEIMGGWRFPGVIGEVGPKIPLEFDKIWRAAQARASKPVKMGTNCADGLAAVLYVHTDHYGDSRRQLMWDIATVINAELRALVAAGCKVIQIEDPHIQIAAGRGRPAEEIDFLVDLFNYQVEGCEEAEIWVHTCYGNAGAQGRPRSQRTYGRTIGDTGETAIDVYFGRCNADVIQIESKDTDHEPLATFAKYKGKRLPKKLCVGMITHRSVQVERPDEVAADIRRWLEIIDPEQLVLGSDCGFGRQGVSRSIATYKASALAQGANIVRRELGGEERYVPAADWARQLDVAAPGRAEFSYA